MNKSQFSEEKVSLLTSTDSTLMINIAQSDEETENNVSKNNTLHLVPQNSRQLTRHKLKTNKLLISEHRKVCNLHRGICRYSRFIFLFVTVPIFFLYLLFYLPIKSNASNRHAMLLDWPISTSRNVTDYVLPSEETTLIAPTDMCRGKVFLIITVTSDLQNFNQRQIIRETWGNTTEFNYEAFEKLHAHLNGKYLKPTKERLDYYSEFLLPANTNNATFEMSVKVRVVFLMGRSKAEYLIGNESLTRLHNEAKQYNDIIQENFIDTYNNLTIKSVLALKYLAKNCLNQSAYFMKCDDDTFVNLPNLLHILLGGTIPVYKDSLEFYNQHTSEVMPPTICLNETSGLLIGHVFNGVEPVNDVSSKWYMPSYMYPGELYPSYLSGAGYIMSMDVVQRLYDVALNTSLIYLEDVYLTGICRQAAHINLRHMDLFSYLHSKHWCAYKGIITQHRLKGEIMLEVWKFVSNYSQQCRPPDTN